MLAGQGLENVKELQVTCWYTAKEAVVYVAALGVEKEAFGEVAY